MSDEEELELEESTEEDASDLSSIAFPQNEFADLYTSRQEIAAPTRCEFVSGAAGVGKTFEILRRCEDDPSYAILSASTGVAAVNLNATTIHSLLGFFDYDSLRDAYLRKSAQQKLRSVVADGYRNVVIDEVSMIPHYTLDTLIHIFDDVNENLKESQHPVGLILVGDVCLDPETGVTMADGSLRKAGEIKRGMKLMGPDFKPRTVQKTVSGRGQMFRVKQTNADDYVVNAGHRLALKRGPNGSHPTMRWGKDNQYSGVRYPHLPEEITISALEHSQKPERFRNCFVGYKAGCIPLPCREVTIDPYFLGLWLGDGDKDGPRITTGGGDIEVVNFCNNYAKKLGMCASLNQDGDKYAIRIRIRNIKPTNANVNQLWQWFKDYDLPHNKHIPEDYLLNCVQTRLELLAGLLDSDGSWGGNRYVFVSCIHNMAKSVKQLADQLGFRTAISPVTWGLAAGKAWTVTIGGDTWRIPCKVKRKISKKRELGRSRMTSTLKVDPIGEGEYAGFEVDGDQRFLLADGTVTYNCQLPPIPERGPKGKPRVVPWCFDATCWPRFEENTTRLTQNWRQSDPGFLLALSHARAGRGEACVAELVRAGTQFETVNDMEFDGTTILAENKHVDTFNSEALKRVQGRDMYLPSRRWGKERGEWKNIPLQTHVREGAYVMLLANSPGVTRGTFEYVNGDCGHIRGITQRQGAMPTINIELVRTGKIVQVPPIVRGVDYREKPDGFSSAKKTDESYYPAPHYANLKKRWVAGQVQYYPLRLAYATTCQKAQGLTLDRCQVDLRTWQFGNPGMAYIAMSRCRSLEGLRIVGMREKVAMQIKVDPRVTKWL